jgi:hypothetical protein
MLLGSFRPRSPIAFKVEQTLAGIGRSETFQRAAQDDDFVGILTKNILNKLALMGLRPGLLSAVPTGLRSVNRVLTQTPSQAGVLP